MDWIMSTSSKARERTIRLQQACAVPYKFRKKQLFLCLVTSTRGRWIFPKGCIEKGHTAADTALAEAFEEAGLEGRIIGAPLGVYESSKEGFELSVQAMLMEVTHCHRHWAEESFRERRWVKASEIDEWLGDAELRRIARAAIDRLAGTDS